MLRVTVNVACEQHGGEFDIHAEELTIVERGRTAGESRDALEARARSRTAGSGFAEYRVFRYLKHRGSALAAHVWVLPLAHVGKHTTQDPTRGAP